MLLLRLWNYIRGYVIIVVEGYFLEKFINICMHRQVFLWDVRKRNDCSMALKVSIKGFKLLRPIVRKTNCRVNIIKKVGFPFILNRYRRRKTFIAGAFIFVILFYLLTSFVWVVDVTGNKNLETRFILDTLAQIGVRPGVLKYAVDADRTANELMLKIKEIGWVGVVVKGTKVKVEVVERVQPPELVHKDVPCDIVAGKDGVVKSIVAKTGQEMVHEGETVTKGQVLISGTVKSKNEQLPPRLVHADGVVKARTWYEKECPVNETIYEKERTGREKEQYSLVLFMKEIGLFHGSIPFKDYEKVEIRKRVSLEEDLTLPFELVIYKYYENIVRERKIDVEEAKKTALDEAYKEVMKEIPAEAEIVKKDSNFKQKENGETVASVTLECIENIGIANEIGGQ
ncbi:MAG: sporulation protein YqfD [Clostridiales bacterium]|jgi:similar to stage IV sporulation protein|nr:sporulation protein YqfD [Eubacteriales bacterium]MDH7565337.1 sporulation protein YqfD [Clostridiales bacterium]